MDRDKSDRSGETVLTTAPRGEGQPCKGKKPDGTPCKGQALPGSEFCFFHDPARRGEVVEAARRGGSRRSIEIPEGELLTPEKARRLLAGVIFGTLVGEIPEGVARTVGYLLQVDARVREGDELEKRIAALEDMRKMQEKLEAERKLQEKAAKKAGPSWR